jgi:hypothetical protein
MSILKDAVNTAMGLNSRLLGVLDPDMHPFNVRSDPAPYCRSSDNLPGNPHPDVYVSGHGGT